MFLMFLFVLFFVSISLIIVNFVVFVCYVIVDPVVVPTIVIFAYYVVVAVSGIFVFIPGLC